jgi:hypothetical protein
VAGRHPVIGHLRGLSRVVQDELDRATHDNDHAVAEDRVILSQIPKLRSAELFSELIHRTMKLSADEYVHMRPVVTSEWR